MLNCHIDMSYAYFLKYLPVVNDIFDPMDIDDDSDKSINWSPEMLGVIFALLGVDSSTVTVASVSSPGDIEVSDTSGGDKRSFGE